MDGPVVIDGYIIGYEAPVHPQKFTAPEVIVPGQQYRKLFGLMRIGRLELLLPAASNGGLMVLLYFGLERAAGRTNPELDHLGLAAAIGLVVVLAGGLTLYGLALNDVVDTRWDRAFRPDRPLAAGRVATTTALTLAVCSLLGALLAAVLLGQVAALLCVVAAAGILFYNIVGKFLPAVGIVTLGLIRAVTMFAANPAAGFAWPILLMMVHVIFCAAVGYALDAKRPRMTGRDWLGISGGVMFWTLALTVAGDVFLGPLAAVGVFVILAWRLLRGRTRSLRSSRAAGVTFIRVAMLWLIVYDVMWLLAADLLVYGVSLAVACTVTALVWLVIEHSAGVERAQYTVTPNAPSGEHL